MFWRFGGYANISTLDSILDKPDVTLEDLLDESDLIQELKQHNSKLIEYLRDEKILRRLLEYTTTPEAPKAEDDGEESDGEPTLREKSLSPFRRSKEQKERSRRKEERDEWDKADKARQRYAYVASEILASETWSIIESLMANQHLLKNFWQFLNREPPLEASAAGYFTKVNETLLEKKTEETLRFVKSQPDVIPAMLKHIDCPMVMDLLLKIISMEKSEGGIGIVDVRVLIFSRFARYANSNCSGYKVKTLYRCFWGICQKTILLRRKLQQAISSKPLLRCLPMLLVTQRLALVPTILPDN